ncbi:MAG: EF-hand domain-containing protein [Rhodocyclales bacterium GT-UBC]|nr:MAG: EF-hand domain-containing protein [Rhodocyclales bacterium GT-UBC]
MVSSVSSTSSISQLFAKLDTKSQGYIEKSDLATAFSKISSSSSSDSTSVDEVFTALDSNSDGKVTESEFSTTLSKLKEELDNQFSSMRMNGFGGTQGSGGMSGMPPPPPPGDDEGFTQEELSSQLDEIGSSDSERSTFISNIVSNFSAADTDGNGKVSFAEAQAYNDSSSTTSSTSSSTTSTTSSATTISNTATSSIDSDAQLLKKIMQLMHAYNTSSQDQQTTSLSSLLSTSA